MSNTISPRAVEAMPALAAHVEGTSTRRPRREVMKLPSDARPISLQGLRLYVGKGPQPATKDEIASDLAKIASAQARAKSTTTPAKITKAQPARPKKPARPSRTTSASPRVPPLMVASTDVSAKVELHAAAMSADAEYATKTLDLLNYTADARERGRAPDAALMHAVKSAIAAGYCDTVQAMWDRCTWTEWKAIANATANTSRGEMRARIFFLSDADKKFTAQLFPVKAEREALRKAIKERN